MYYLNSRYYDPEIGRFVNSDSTNILAASGNFYDKNLFVYCDNNPIVRKDSEGDFWETALDVISLGASIVEVSMNPTDVFAWAGLVGDVVDLTPFVTGLGEVVDVYRHTAKAGDNIVDVAKGMDLSKDIRKGFGSYEIEFVSGNVYEGKGGFDRAIKSATQKSVDYNDSVTSIRWKSSKNNKEAFIDEYYMQAKAGGRIRDGANVYNRIWSPGKRYSGVQRY